MVHNKILKIIKNCIINLIIFILGIIAIITIWTTIQLNIQNKEFVNIFGYSIFSTETASMYPTIQIGDIVVVKIGEQTKEKDIITYKKDNAFITHRIIEINGDSIIAKGDNNNTQDEAITKDAIIGKVVFIISNVEVWKLVFSDFGVLIPIVITVILFVILVSYKEKTGEKND
jgi:signal peptidase